MMLSEHKLEQIARILGIKTEASTEEQIASALMNLKPYSRGVAINKILSQGLFASERRLFDELGLVSKKGIGIGMETMLARLPETVLSVFQNCDSIQIGWVFKIKSALNLNPDIVYSVCQRIVDERSAGARIPAKEVFKRINNTTRKDPIK